MKQPLPNLQIQEQPLTDSLAVIEKDAEKQNLVNQYNDKLAENEALDKFTDQKRTQEYKKHIHLIITIWIYMLFVVITLLFLVRMYHFISPISWRWLSEDESHSIERILFSGTIATLATKYFGKHKLW